MASKRYQAYLLLGIKGQYDNLVESTAIYYIGMM